MPSHHTLFLVIEPARRGWRSVRITRVSRKRPQLPRPTEQACVRLNVALPDDVFKPREVSVEIKPEHILAPVVTVQSEKP